LLGGLLLLLSAVLLLRRNQNPGLAGQVQDLLERSPIGTRRIAVLGLVDAALQRHPAPRDVLIGGLGVGFSVLAALDDSRVERITVVEIEQSLVDWHDTHLAAFTGGLLRDPRVTVVVADIATHLAACASSYDVVCLDVDNGPEWTVTDTNAALYDDAGSRLLVGALRPQGVLSVWSAHSSPEYEQRLRTVLDDLTVLEVRRDRGEPDVIYLGRRPAT